MKPDHTDVVFVFNQHDPLKFEQFIERKSESGDLVGFVLCGSKQQYYFDEDGGWMDYNGCYYDSEGKPAGWVNLSEDQCNYAKFDLDYNFVENGDNKYYTNDFEIFEPMKQCPQKQYYDQQPKKKESNNKQKQDSDLRRQSDWTVKEKKGQENQKKGNEKGDQNKKNQTQSEKREYVKKDGKVQDNDKRGGPQNNYQNNNDRSKYQRVDQKKNQDNQQNQKKGQKKQSEDVKQSSDRSKYQRIQTKDEIQQPKEQQYNKEKQQNNQSSKNQGDENCRNSPYVQKNPNQQEESSDTQDNEQQINNQTIKKQQNNNDIRDEQGQYKRNQNRQYDQQKANNDRKNNNRRRKDDENDEQQKDIFLIDITQMDESIQEEDLKKFLIEKSGVTLKDIQKFEHLKRDGLVYRVYVTSSMAAYKIQRVSKQKLGEKEIHLQL